MTYIASPIDLYRFTPPLRIGRFSACFSFAFVERSEGGVLLLLIEWYASSRYTPLLEKGNESYSVFYISLQKFRSLPKWCKEHTAYVLKQLPMRKIYSLREPYNPPTGEVFMFQTGISMLVAFSLEEVDDPEMGPDLTPREDIRTDIL